MDSVSNVIERFPNSGELRKELYYVVLHMLMYYAGHSALCILYI
jgi:hypothetical protein